MYRTLTLSDLAHGISAADGIKFTVHHGTLGSAMGDIVRFSMGFCFSVTVRFSVDILVGFSDGSFMGDTLWKQHTILTGHKLESGSIQHHVSTDGPVLFGEREQIVGEGSTPPTELRVPLHHHGFVMNWGLGMVAGVIYYYETTKIKFHLLLCTICCSFLRALFERNF